MGASATHLHPSQRAGSSTSPVSRTTVALREMAVQDWMVLAYHIVLVGVALANLQGFHGARALAETSSLLLWFAGTLALVRGRWLSGTRLEAVAYRLGMVGTVHLSYFTFRRLLPLANSSALDLELYAFDVRVFGFEPAVAVERLSSFAVIEWFSFFYYGYFYFLSAHIISIVFFSRDRRRLGEFTAGLIVTFCVGHLTYMLVPAYGPGTAMPQLFESELVGGRWYRLMLETVEAGGAYKDVFPSIHTAVPTYITLWSYRHRQSFPYRFTWVVSAAISMNIIAATMVLRWHYLIDVVAGLALACVALNLGKRLTDHELARRTRADLRPVWPE